MISARLYIRKPWLRECSLYSFAIVAWINAASAIDSSARIGMSQIRTSRVEKNGCGRTSHQIFLALSMLLVLTSRLTKLSKSAQLVKVSGMLVRGNLSNTLQRYDFNPVFRPIQNGELADSASRCGRK